MLKSFTKDINKKPNAIGLILLLWGNLKRKRKKQFYLVLFLMVVSGVLEVLSVISLLPLLAVLSDSESISNYRILFYLVNVFDVQSDKSLLTFVIILFFTVVTLSGIMRLFSLYVNTLFAANVGHELSMDLFEKTMYQSYETHINRNSSVVVAAGSIHMVQTVQSFLTSLQTITAFISTLLIIISLVILSWKVAIISTLIFTMSYLLILLFTKKKIRENSITIAYSSEQQLKSLQESLNGIKDVIINNLQKFYISKYRLIDSSVWSRQSQNQVLNGFPRYLFETVGLLLVAVIALFMSIDNNEKFSSVVPLLGAFSLGALRLLSSMQSVYSGVTIVRSYSSSILNVINLLKQSFNADFNLSDSKFNFFNTIKLKDISFSYSESSTPSLNNINLSINKGEKIGIVGENGSGKSTFINLFMGLLNPCDGRFEIDGDNLYEVEDSCNKRIWMNSICHVPQNIFLLDDSILENIALGTPIDEIDIKEVKKCAKLACIDDFIESLPDNYSTIVGENGAFLSGGQKQRIGLARALYRRKAILILDEATSALDKDTEIKVMESIKLIEDMTIIMISHNHESICQLDRIIEFKDGTVIKDIPSHKIC